MKQEELEKANKICRDINSCKKAIMLLSEPDIFSLGVVKFGGVGKSDVSVEIPIQLKSDLKDMLSNYLKSKEDEFRNFKTQ